MFRLIKRVFIALLTFSRSLATKCVSLNSEAYIVRPTVTDLNPIEFNYYPFIISIDKGKEICNVDDVLSMKIWVKEKMQMLKYLI